MAEETRTIAIVREETNSWTSDDGKLTLEFITVVFEDGQEGSVSARPDDVGKFKDALLAIKGMPSKFDLDFKGEFNGVKQWKIKTFPGKPSSSIGGGGRGGGRGGGNWESAEERAVKNASIEAQVASDRATSLAIAWLGSGQSKWSSLDEMAEWVAKSTPVIAAGIREAAVPREVPKPAAASTSSTPAEQDAGSGPAEDASDSAVTEGFDGVQITRTAGELRQVGQNFYGSIKALKEAFAEYFGEEKVVNAMTAEELTELLENAGAAL